MIDIDHPPPEIEEAVVPERDATPERSVTFESNNTSSQPDIVLKNGDEWSSPAFIKRARTSYGSLFDTGYDPFAEEDGSIPGKGRKRSRLSSTWRYISRSPSPEPDEESIPATSPTPAVAPTMADEGSQTVDELRDTAETLAHFSRQASDMLRNAEVSTLGDADQQYDTRLPEIHTSEMLPPETPTRVGLPTADVIQQVYIQEETTPQAPSSPRLKPVSSDALPLVSPLMPSTPNPFVQNGDGIGQSTQTTGILPPDSLSQEPPLTEDGHGEPVRTGHVHLEGEHIPGFPVFHDHAMAMSEIDHQGFQGQLLSNTQFEWESVNPEFESPSKDEPHAEQFFVDGEGEAGHGGQRFEEHLAHSFPIPPPEATSYSQYPPLDRDLRPIDSTWGLGPGAVSYPDLPEPQPEIGHTVNNALPSSPTGISHAKDVQSAIVDITESDGESEERHPSERSGDDNVRGGSVEDLEEVYDEDEEEDERLDVVDDEASERDETLRRQYDSEDEMPLVDEDYSEENEDYDHHDQQEEFSDEDRDGEGSDEDDMEVDEPQYRPPVQKEPVVIDLLSSDEEDNEDMPVPSPQPAMPREEAESEVASESEQDEDESVEDESDAEMDDEQEPSPRRNIPYSQRTELPASIPRDALREPSEEESSDGEPSDEEQDVLEKDAEKHAAIDEDVEEEKHGPTNEVERHVEVDEDMDDEQQAPTNEDSRHVEERDMDDEQHAAANEVERHVEVDEDMEEVVERAEDQDKPLTEDNEDVDLAQTNQAVQAEEIPISLAQSPAQLDGPSDTKTVETPAHKQPPSLRARLFNLDGANDEDTAVSSFPAPPKKVTATRQTLDSKPSTQTGTDQGNTQLPTPDATQAAVVMDSQEESSLISGSLHPMESSQQSTRDQQTGAAEETEEVIKSAEQQSSIETRGAPNDLLEKPAEKQVEDTNPVSPRRSRRIGKLSGSAAQIAEMMRPSIADDSQAKGKLGGEQKSPVTMDSQADEEGPDPSIQMAMSVLKSPAKPQHDLRSTSTVDLKLGLSRSLRTDLSEFTALKVVRFHLNQKLDVLGIVTSTPAEPQRMKGGPRHYQITFNITDSTIAPSGVTEVQVYRPYIEALPIVKEGDGILLRNFQVIAIKNRGFALRSEQNEASSWAVYKDGASEPEVRGPPVEQGKAEQSHMVAMKEWYSSLDAASVAKLQRANADKGSGVGKGAGKGT